MKKIIELEFDYNGETKLYYTFKLKMEATPTQLFPKKIYLWKELFDKEPKTIRMIINEKEK